MPEPLHEGDFRFAPDFRDSRASSNENPSFPMSSCSGPEFEVYTAGSSGTENPLQKASASKTPAKAERFTLFGSVWRGGFNKL